MTKKLEIALVFIFIGSALAFGGVQPIAYSLAEISIFVAVVLLLWNQQRHGRINLSLPIWPLLFVLWVGLQLLPLPRAFVAEVSPADRLTSTWLGAIDPRSFWATMSIYPNATLVDLFKILAYLGAFIIAVHVFDSSRRKSVVVPALICLGCFEAGYGIIQHLLSWNKIFGVTDPYDLWVAIGTYINRNHFAGVIELTFPFAFASAFYSYQLWSEPKHSDPSARRGSDNISSLGFRVVFFLFLVVIMILSVVFSYSRGGILSIAITLIVLSLLTLLKVRRKSWGLVIGSLAALALGFSLWIGIGTLVFRFHQMGQSNYLQTSERSMIWSDTAQLFRANPILGTGLGTYGQALRPFQTKLVNMYVDHAHNDYLEFASETGLVGFGLLFIPIFYLLVRMIIAFLKDHRRYRRAVLLGCIGSTLGLLIHSFTDFNLHIPANAIIFAVILGIGYKAACIEPQKEAKKV
ncbi:MAG: O-antigen ligase family protein [Acidobacteriota bacterium]